jgi:Xaa-Pro aminopeptidase
MEIQSWDAFLTADRRTTYYLTGFLAPAETAVVCILWSDGRTALISNSQSTGYADEMLHLETYSTQRSLDFLNHDAAGLLDKLLSQTSRGSAKNWALDMAAVNVLCQEALRKTYPRAQWFDASRTLLRLRKKKEDDEIAIIKQNLEYCAAAYSAARKAIKPGVTEIEVFNAMQAAVVLEAGTSLELPGDFACGERSIRGGGAPTTRQVLAGDLYPLDLFPARNLYASDTCRTFAVGKPTELQQQAWEITLRAVRLGESIIKPGVRARDVYWEIKNFLDGQKVSEKSFWHHAGHGIGHRGQECPRIIPGSDDVFEEGDVFTLEPGVYTQALQGGIRLEDNYVLRAQGPEDLFEYPWEL